MTRTTGRRSLASGLPDHRARDAILNDLESTLIVEAAAGTGKTTALIGRVLRVLEAGLANVDGIVAVTFTEKAAGELKLRLREQLEVSRTGAVSPETRDRLDEALKNLEEAHISTIHGFCADLLRERPVEARVDPLFTVLTEPQADRLYGEAFQTWLQEQLADPPEGVRRALRRSSAWNDGPIDRLRSAGRALVEWRDFPAPWTREPFDRAGEIRRLVEQIHHVAGLTANPSYARDYLFLDTSSVRTLSDDLRRHADPGTDELESRLVDLARDRKLQNVRHGRGPDYAKGITRASIVSALDALKVALDQFRAAADADLAALLQQELLGSIARYEELKAKAGALDFLDLLLKTYEMLRRDAAVLRAFRGRFARIFVDEFQDTDPLQAEILLLLSASDAQAPVRHDQAPGPKPHAPAAPGKLFIVGDPKQSIYRFRRADVAVYRKVCDELIAQGAKHVKLTTSFRAVPNIQACVNAGFAPVMAGDEATLQPGYVPLTPYRKDDPKRPSVVVLPVPEPYGTRNISAIAIEKSLPDAAGAFVDWLIHESSWQSEGRPIEARDVCILFRRFVSFGDDVTRPYVEALEARGVPHVLVGGKTFHDREEVETIRAALTAVEWPDDELSVFATLRGALFAIGDEDLLDWHTRYRGFHPFRVPEEFAEQRPRHLLPVAEALLLLQRLHRRRNYRPVADTIGDLLAATRAHVGFVLRAGGEQALANVLHVAELARRYEMEGGISFRGFVDELREAGESAQSAEAPILEEGNEGVRLMTVHKAKGLEFPVVLLADLTCKLSRAEAGRWIDPDRRLCALKLAGWAPHDLLRHDGEEAARDQAEAIRLAYVAATRAKDLLVVPAIGDEAYEGGWLDPLNAAIYPPMDQRRDPARAPATPSSGSKDTVLNRPEGDPARPSTVAPGMYKLDSARQTKDQGPRTHSVIWWDPKTLHLHATPTLGLRRDDLIVKDVDMFTVDRKVKEYEQWQSSRDEAVRAGSQPALLVRSVTEALREAPGADQAPSGARVDVVDVVRRSNRPYGPRFGSLVHAVLALVPLDAAPSRVQIICETQGRILGASVSEVGAATEAAVAVLKHPLMDRARAAHASGRLRRELPLAHVVDGTLVEGTVDLLIDDDDGVVVVDFKTDRELEEDVERYSRQVMFYCDAVSRGLRRAASGAILRV